MKIFSHNTMSYRKPKQWWLKPFYWLAKCQSKNYKEQYKCGARLFDIRIKFSKSGEIEFGHGIFSYQGDDWLDIFEFCKNNDIPIRLQCEYARNDREIEKFKFLCKFAESNGIYVFGGCVRNRYWEQVYEFKNYPMLFKDLYSSQTALFPYIPWLDDWIPLVYAKLNNKKNFAKYKDTNETIMIDFI